MEIMKEEKLTETKLTESKEKLPISFLTDFVSRGWDDVGYLKETIKQGDYNNVIVMSDDDIENQNNHGESYTVTGCVWWL